MNGPFVRYKNFGRSFFRSVTIQAFDRQTDISVMAKSALHRCSAVKSIVVVLFFYSLLLLHDFSTKLSRTLWPLFRPVCLSFFCLRLLLAWEAYRGQAVRRGYACVCVSLSPFFAFVSPECLAGRVLINLITLSQYQVHENDIFEVMGSGSQSGGRRNPVNSMASEPPKGFLPKLTDSYHSPATNRLGFQDHWVQR